MAEEMMECSQLSNSRNLAGNTILAHRDTNWKVQLNRFLTAMQPAIKILSEILVLTSSLADRWSDIS